MRDAALPISMVGMPAMEAGGSVAERTAQELAAQELRRQTALTVAIGRVLQAALTASSDAEVARIFLAEAEALTCCELGWVGEVGGAGQVSFIARSDVAWAACNSSRAEPAPEDRVAACELFRQVLRSGGSLLANPPDMKLRHGGPPDGSPVLTSFLGVPLKVDGRVIGLVALANKPSGFSAQDRDTIEAMSVALVEALLHKRAAAALRRSEELFRHLFEHHAAVKLILDPSSGAIVDANLAAERFYGWSRDQLRKMKIQEINLLPSEELRQEMEKARAARRVRFEFRHRLADGSVRDVEVFSSRIEVEGADLLHSIVHDTTERRRAEAERGRLTTAIEQAAEAIVVTDSRGCIVYVNPAFESVTGYGSAEVMGQNPRLLKSGLQDEAFYGSLWSTISGGRTWHGRMVNRRKDGTHYTEEAVISPVRDAAGLITSYVAVKRDVTSQLALEEQLLQAQKMEAVGRLASGIAHDFNNLLVVILASGGALAESFPEGDVRRRDAEDVVAAGERAAALVRQLLAFARKSVTRPVPCDVGAVVKGIEKLLRRSIGEDIAVRLELEPRRWWTRIDPGHLEQVLMNLAVNARDAMPGGGELRVEARYASFERPPESCRDLAPGGYVILRVTDTGCGMTPEVRARMFDPFFTTKEHGKGTGLGLATVHGIVEQAGGRIAVESEPGQGASFTVYLPPCDGPPEAGVEALGARRHQGHGRTILLVEDESEVRRAIRGILERNGFRVLEAQSGSEGYRTLVEEAVELVLSDVVMPAGSGDGLASAVRMSHPRVPVVLMSGYTDLEGREGVASGPILPKPFSEDALLARLMAELGDRRAERWFDENGP